MSYAPPPAPPPVPQPSRGGRITVIVVAIVLAVVLLCCLGVAGVGYWFYRTVDDAISPPRDAAVAHFELLRSGDVDTAYRRMCQARRNDVSAAEFAAQIADRPRIVDYEVSGARISNVNGQVSAEVAVDISYDGGTQGQESVKLIREDGAWRVCR